jgi:hypothetical protein
MPLAAAFGSLFGSTVDKTFAIRERLAIDACDRCREKLGHTLNASWMSCVAKDLYERQEAARSKADPGSGEKRVRYYPVEEDELDRLSPGGRPGARTDELMNIMRNYSCEVADGGSQPVRHFTWTWRPADPCANATGGSSDDSFKYSPGFLPAGNDLRAKFMSEQAAKQECAADVQCAGVTFSAPEDSRSPGAEHNMLFKSSAEGWNAASGWHTWRKQHRPDCSAAARQQRAASPEWSPTELTVHVLRESPPVYVVDDFVSDAECDAMLADTLPKMGRSVVGGGGTSNWRQSYSVNMVPDFEYEEHLITRIARRKFAFAREVAGYDVIEGEGQEPINAVYYKDNGDQYRPHCDGECHGAKYTLGSRVASSLAYCAVADKGGYTLFTRTHLKVVPRRRQMLFFGYFFKPGSTSPGTPMDNGHTEHTGCPLREGRKWIACVLAHAL